LFSLHFTLLSFLFSAVHNSTKWRKSWRGHKAFSNDSWCEYNDRSSGLSTLLTVFFCT